MGSLSLGTVTRGPRVPPASFLKEHQSAVTQHTRKTLTFTYQTSYGLAAATYAEPIVINLNSPYDPDIAAGGASAQGYAKLIAFYSKCYVVGTRMKVKAVNYDTTLPRPPIIAGITVSTNSGTLGSYTAATQVGLVDYDVVGTNPDHFKREVSLDVAKFLDKPNILDDPELYGTSGSGPLSAIYGHFWLQNMSGVTTSYIGYIVEVTYDCVFTDPIPFT
jgi:hypothetical protein